MNKRKQAFLDKKTKLVKFTESSLLNVYGFTNEEVQKMINDKFIVPVGILMCSSCYTSKTDDVDECMICGGEEFHENTSYYRYG